jgi:tetratricopeptide (TPR) repeat protein
MRIPRQVLYSALTCSLTIASVLLPARTQAQPPKTPGVPLPIKIIVPSPQQPGAVGSCKKQIKTRFADDPNGSRANYELGWCHLSSKEFGAAAAAFQKSIQLIPEWIKKREDEDTSHLPELSEKQAEELRSNASPSLALFSLGWTYHQAGRYDEAVAVYQQIKSAYPAAEEARYQTAMVHLIRGNRDAALEQVAKMGKRFEQRLDVESKLLIPDLVSSDKSVSNGAPIIQKTDSLRPTILYREKAKYTEDARQARMQGTVELQVIFRSDGVIVIQRVTRYLPYGLTLTTVEAASKIKFKPAMKDGSPVSVKAPLTFDFNLY